MQPKKREITKKNVSVSVLFLYFESCLCKMFIYSILPYIKITFTRFLYENKLHFPCNQYVGTKIDIFAEITKHSADFKVIALVCCLAVGWDHPVPLEIS